MGETAIDEETFNEYLEEMRQHYTADKVRSDGSTASPDADFLPQYHLLGMFQQGQHPSA